MAQRVTHNGFSVEKPRGAGWTPIGDQRRMVTFRNLVPGTTTSIVAFGRTLPDRASGWAGLQALAQRLTPSTDDSRPVRRRLAGADCVFKRFARPFRSKSGRQYRLNGADLYCRHPRTGAVVHLGFSQRHPVGQAGAAINSQMLRFFNSLRFR
jgi:hypothetical protein